MADDNNGEQQPTFTFHGWKYHNYFDYVTVKDEKTITVRCTLCAGRKILSTAKNTTSNLLKRKLPVRTGVELPQRKSFSTWLDKEYMKMESKLKATLGEVDFVSTTADIWTANNKSFLGVTVHWISSTTLQRHKAAIACKRIKGSHTFDINGSEIEHIHSSYGLVGKVVVHLFCG